MRVIPLILMGFLLGACVEQSAEVSAPVPVENKPGVVAKKPEVKPVVKAEVRKPVEKKPVVKPGEITGVDVGQLFAMKQAGQVYLVDVRPPLFYRLGHIEGAVNFPLRSYDKAFPREYPGLKAAVDGGKVVVLYCQNVDCPDAYKTGLKLVKLGHDVSIYKGGWEEWKRAGL